MILREQSHPPGTFSHCNGCHREPLHIRVDGRCTTDPIDILKPVSAERHVIECCRCSRKTARHPTLDEAIAEWGAAYSQGELSLRLVRPRAA